MVKMHARGDVLLANVIETLLKNGWYGGQWVRYVGRRKVDLATESEYAGFLLLGHRLKDLHGYPYNYTEGYGETIPYEYENKAVNAYGQVAIIAGGGDYDFNENVYDTTKTYTYNQTLFVNNNSVLTNVDSGNSSIGLVNVIPSDNNGWLGVNLKY